LYIERKSDESQRLRARSFFLGSGTLFSLKEDEEEVVLGGDLDPIDETREVVDQCSPPSTA
jgi:hypothetical protein